MTSCGKVLVCIEIGISFVSRATASVIKVTTMGALLSAVVFQPPSVCAIAAESMIQRHAIAIPLQHDHSSGVFDSALRVPAFYINIGSTITVIFSHGNAEDLTTIYDRFQYFANALNVNVIAYDYFGYGATRSESPSIDMATFCSPGSTVSLEDGKHLPTEKGCYRCIDSVYAFAVNTLGIHSENIILYGRSLGSGPSIYLADRLSRSRVRLGGLILQVGVMFAL